MESGSSFDSNPIPLGYYYPYWWDGNSIEHLVLLIEFRDVLGRRGGRRIFLLELAKIAEELSGGGDFFEDFCELGKGLFWFRVHCTKLLMGARFF